MELRSITLKDSLLDKEKISRDIISEALSKATNPYALFTGTRGSLVSLHLIKQVQNDKINLPVLHIDTSVEFPEIYQFIEKMRKLWSFSLLTERNKEALRTITIAEDKKLCCFLLKTEALARAIEKYRVDYLFLAKRWDEEGENPFFSVQGKCSLVNPLSHFSEEDTRDYIKKYNLPYCSICGKGCGEIVCHRCTSLSIRNTDKINEDNQDHKEVLKKLKELGYI
jgi:3'-phosphoadenosine 5'-phosphosulfate sulfotransferase (PAPS reductase)/FAD synthetase